MSLHYFFILLSLFSTYLQLLYFFWFLQLNVSFFIFNILFLRRFFVLDEKRVNSISFLLYFRLFYFGLIYTYYVFPNSFTDTWNHYRLFFLFGCTISNCISVFSLTLKHTLIFYNDCSISFFLRFWVDNSFFHVFIVHLMRIFIIISQIFFIGHECSVIKFFWCTSFNSLSNSIMMIFQYVLNICLLRRFSLIVR